MKKLMLAVAVACAAAITQAASCAWNLTADTGYKYNEGFMINAANISAVQAVLDAGGSGVLTSLATYRLGNLATANKGGTIAMQTAEVPDSDSGLSYAWVIIQTTDSGRTITDGTTGYIISAAQTYASLSSASAIVSGSATPTPFAINSNLTAAGALTGTIGAAPEPTSGLLLLLGVAGLALKRKRA